MRIRTTILAAALALAPMAAQALTQPGAESGSFGATLVAGQSYSAAIPGSRMVFSLAPTSDGWTIAVTSSGASCGNLAGITVPPETLILKPAALPAPNVQPPLPPAREISFALTCDDQALFLKGNECRAAGRRSQCTDTGAYAVGRLTFALTAQQVRSSRPYVFNAPPVFQQITFSVTAYTPDPAANTP